MIFVGGRAFCQQTLQNQQGKSPVIFVEKPVNTTFSLAITPFSATGPIFSISPNYYSSHLGFFCKQEIKFEKSTRIPFKFRLGSVQQCDWMEGKPNTFYTKQ